MRILLPLIMMWMLFLSTLTMEAAAAACHLFVTAVLPGLFPYMVLSLMLVSRCGGKLSPGLFLLLGWGGGSPTGARLLQLIPDASRQRQLFLALSCATMSPMFLLGTVGAWLGSAMAGMAVLLSVILGGYLTGFCAGLTGRRRSSLAELPSAEGATARTVKPMSFGAAVELSARTMLLVCGSMVMLRVLARLLTRLVPGAELPILTLMEVTTGVQLISQLPLPLALRTALAAGATGFGGAAILMQNRTVYREGFLSLKAQLLWQMLHGALSLLLALGMMLLAERCGL